MKYGRSQHSTSVRCRQGAHQIATGAHAPCLHPARHPVKLAPVGPINTAIRANLFCRIFFLFSVPTAPDFQKVSGHRVRHGAQDQAGRT